MSKLTICLQVVLLLASRAAAQSPSPDGDVAPEAPAAPPAPAPASPAATTTTTATARTVLVLDLRNDGVSPETARLVDDAVTVIVAKGDGLEVLSSEDMRRRLDVEATKQQLGCDTASASCLAELAGAMGAQDIVYGSIGLLGGRTLVTLNAFDSQSGKSIGRETCEASDLARLPPRVRAATARLTRDITGKAVEQVDVDEPASPWLYPGIALSAVGVVGAVTGGIVAGVAYGTVVDVTPPSQGGPLPSSRVDALGAGRTSLLVAAGGLVVALAGGGAVALAFVE